MMTMHELAPGLLVAAQLEPAQLAAARAAGVRSLVCNRPDGEAPDQPPFAQIAHAAQQLGMQAHYLPVTSSVSDDQALRFRHLLDSLPGPVLAYCRSGMRSTTLWALSHVQQLGVPAVTAAAQRAGYDLAPLAPRLSQLHGASG